MRQNDIEVIYWIISLGVLIATVYYIATGTVNAIRVGRKLNTEQQKDNAKRNLFLTLFALRGSPLHYDYVRCLNEIDVVFEDTPSVLAAWHTHYDSLQIKGQINENEIWDLQRVNLLSEMAVSLGYNKIRQTDMIRSYYPVGHDDQFRDDMDFRIAAKNYYKKGAELYEIMILNSYQSDQSKDETKPES